MTIYVFECEQCDNEIERNLDIRSQLPDIMQCPICHATMRRNINNPNIIYRGSGFYATDKWQYERENPLDSDDI